MPVEKAGGKLKLTHPKGPSVEVLLYGATILSWKSAQPGTGSADFSERLFVSSKAFLDGSKPVRGGIPVVFPCFGAPTLPEHQNLKQHGFARSETWSYDGNVIDTEDSVGIQLTLEPTPSISAVYPRPFHLALVITLDEHRLSTDLHVTNTSTAVNSGPLRFNALFHNYIRAPAENARVGPLIGVMYVDKTQSTDEEKAKLREEHRKGVDVHKFTDFVYQNPPKTIEVVWPGRGLEIKSHSLKDVVVWNPQDEGTKLADMEENGWENFLCVEPGVVRTFASVEPGMTWKGGQELCVISNAVQRYSLYKASAL